MLFTRKGDQGTMQTYGCDQRVSKSSAVAEALGSLDEINSYLGITKVLSAEANTQCVGRNLHEIIHEMQENLFIIQAEVAGYEKRIEGKKVKEAEKLINAIEKELPPITTFFISGGTLMAAHFDVARTIARRAERRVVAVHEEKTQELGVDTLAYMNRLSSILYALARFSNHQGGISEKAPSYC